MAFPVIATSTNGSVVANDSTWDVTYPSGASAGDLFIIIIGTDGSPTVSSISGGLSWVFQNYPDGGAASAMIVAKAIAAGGESGAITVTISATEQGIWQFLRITGWEGTLGTTWVTTNAGAVERVGATSASTSAPNPPSLDPANWGTEDTLWLAAATWDGTVTATAKDANYTYVSGSPATSGGTGGAGLALAERSNAVSAEDPGAFTLSAAESTTASTIGIRPSGAAAVEAAQFHTSYRSIYTGPTTN
jgi:hypothetical protein